MHGRLIAVWIGMAVVGAAAWPQTADSRHACGSIVHIFPDPENLPDLALVSLPASLQRGVKKTLAPLLAEEAKITGADADGSKMDDPEHSLRMHHLGRDAKGNELYAAWWNIPTICGHFDSCPIWLLEVGSGRVNNLVRPNEPDNPAADADGGWGIAVLPSNVPLERLMITSSGFVGPGPGPAQAVPLCWRRRGDFYVSDPCPPSCMDDLNRTDK